MIRSGGKRSKEKRQPIDPDTRRGILWRDHNACRRCGAAASLGTILHVHHIVRVTQGGTDDSENLITICHACHDEWHMLEWRIDLTFAQWLHTPTVIDLMYEWLRDHPEFRAQHPPTEEVPWCTKSPWDEPRFARNPIAREKEEKRRQEASK